MKNKKVIIIAVILVAAVLVYLFWPNIKAMFSKPEPEPESNPNTNTSSNTSSSTTGNTVVIKPIKIGDSVLASKDGVKAYDNELSNVLKTYSKGQWIGTVQKNQNGWLTVMDTGGVLKQVQKTNVKKA